MKFKFINIKVKVKDIIIIVLILGLTFGYYAVEQIPTRIKKVNFIFFEVGDLGFVDFSTMAHFIKMKVLIILYALTWFFTSHHWWKSSILVIITIELLKLISALNPNQRFFDEIEFYTSLPITIPIILLLFYISYKIDKYNLAKKVLYKLDNEVDELFFEIYQDKKKELIKLNEDYKKAQTELSKENNLDYIKQLISIRDTFYKK
ncbi:hypothetical protein [uncultured Psychroserpens sp.]|uniref:hypothetical protein n=1 Tax=uncultured Psychroserpens sp. TaxID=255436 RepID=UPI002605C50A|nr:hypothetical protein [uncultured Psychroserpens sp.]